MREIRIDLPHGVGDRELGQRDAGGTEPLAAPPQHAPVHGRRAREPARFFHRWCRARPHGPDHFEIVDTAPGTFGSTIKVLERSFHDPAVVTDEQERAVGDLTRQLDRLEARRRHDQRNAPARREGEPSRRAVEVDARAGEQGTHRRDACPHLGERGGLPSDRARGGVSGADHELHATGRQLFHRLDPARQHHGVAREWIGDGWKQRHPGRMHRRLGEDDERVTRDHLAVEDPGAVEACRLDAFDELHERRHRRRAGHPHVDAHEVSHGAAIGSHRMLTLNLPMLSTAVGSVALSLQHSGRPREERAL